MGFVKVDAETGNVLGNKIGILESGETIEYHLGYTPWDALFSISLGLV